MPPFVRRSVVLVGVLLLASSLVPASARAQSQVTPVPLNVTPTDCSATIGTSAAQVLPNNGYRRGFLLQNVGTTTIGVSFTDATPAIGAAQTFTLAPGASMNSTATGTPGTALYAISSAAGGVLACESN